MWGIESETFATTPADRTRTTLGVGEEVTLTYKPSELSPITWSVSGGGALNTTTGGSTKFTANDRASTPTVTATYLGHGCTKRFSVLEPSSVTFSKKREISYPPNHVAAGMKLDIVVGPATVSFYNVQFREDDGPASNQTGGFAKYSGQNLGDPFYHDANNLFFAVDMDNSIVVPGEDTVFINVGPQNLPLPSTGSFEWIIPYRFKVSGQNSSKIFSTVTQAFSVTTAGNITITKGAASVTR